MQKAFTLIELLIVVAIIAILAAIAVPNFLEAQTRAKVSRSKADQRAIATGLEVYHIDHNAYPRCNHRMSPFSIQNKKNVTLERLTTPVAYMTGEGSFRDPFGMRGLWINGPQLLTSFNEEERWVGQFYFYTARTTGAGGNSRWADPDKPNPHWWILEAAAPDGYKTYTWMFLNPHVEDTPAARAEMSQLLYDASNGTLSQGSVWRVGGTPLGHGAGFYQLAQLK
jgi:prepilin-type N-terminal cleavage/methylation domain-containing protein